MLDDRFWAKVDVKGPNECWEWKANKNNMGYGMFSCRGLGYFNKKLAHRLSFEDANGPIEDGKHIMHACDNPACVNPGHLSAGSRKENMVDCARKFRYKQQKYHADKIVLLLKDYVAGGMSRAELSAKHGIPVSSLSDFTTGDSHLWLHGTNGCPTTDQIRDARTLKPGAKITPAIAQQIKDRLAAGETGRNIATLYGIHAATVSDIKKGKTWR